MDGSRIEVEGGADTPLQLCSICAVSSELTNWSVLALAKATTFMWPQNPGGEHCCYSLSLLLLAPCWIQQQEKRGSSGAHPLGFAVHESKGQWPEPAIVTWWVQSSWPMQSTCWWAQSSLRRARTVEWATAPAPPSRSTPNFLPFGSLLPHISSLLWRFPLASTNSLTVATAVSRFRKHSTPTPHPLCT